MASKSKLVVVIALILFILIAIEALPQQQPLSPQEYPVTPISIQRRWTFWKKGLFTG